MRTTEMLTNLAAHTRLAMPHLRRDGPVADLLLDEPREVIAKGRGDPKGKRVNAPHSLRVVEPAPEANDVEHDQDNPAPGTVAFKAPLGHPADRLGQAGHYCR